MDTLMKGGICPSQVPRDMLVSRCVRDVSTTHHVMRMQMHLLEKRKQLPLVVTRCLLTPILVDMERTGMQLDPERVNEEYTKYADDYAAASRDFGDFTGGVNPRSPDQMAHYLYGDKGLRFPEQKDKGGHARRNKPSKQFPKGRPKTDKHTLDWLKGKAKTKKQKDFIELRERVGKLGSALTKNLQFFKGVCDERGGHFHTELRQGVTATHRLSGGGMPLKFEAWPRPKSVQGQNMPNIFKRLFTTRDPDYQYEECDAKQLEFRVAAFLGQDAVAIADIRNPDFDAHLQSACVMADPDFDGTINKVLYDNRLYEYQNGDALIKQQRKNAKADTFKPLYGGEKGTDLQERYYAWFKEHYAGMERRGQANLAMVEDVGKMGTETGLTFYWPDTYTNRNGLTMDGKKHRPIKPSVYNYPVQYLATGEIVPIALIHLYYRVRRENLRVLFTNTVHDSVGAEVHKEDHARWQDLCVLAFTKDVYSYLHRVYDVQFNVPLGVEVVYGTHWSEGLTFDVDVEPGEN